MRRDPARDEFIKTMSAKFRSAVMVLQEEQHLNDIECTEFLNRQFKLNIKPSRFSKLHSAHLNFKHIKDVNEMQYRRIFKHLDPYIEKNYGKKYIGADYVNYNSKVSDERLTGLIGTYVCYSWDSSTTEATGKEHIHMFKVEITSVNSARCETKGAQFKGTRMELISPDRVVLEIGNNQRKVFLVLHIGFADTQYIKKQLTFPLVYADSGNTKIKSGIAILERTKLNYDSDIIPQSKLASTLDDRIVRTLRMKQIII